MERRELCRFVVEEEGKEEGVLIIYRGWFKYWIFNTIKVKKVKMRVVKNFTREKIPQIL